VHTKSWLEKPEGKKPHGRPWEDNNRKDLREIRWEGVEWMHRDQDRDQWQALANMALNLQVP